MNIALPLNDIYAMRPSVNGRNLEMFLNKAGAEALVTRITSAAQGSEEEIQVDKDTLIVVSERRKEALALLARYPENRRLLLSGYMVPADIATHVTILAVELQQAKAEKEAAELRAKGFIPAGDEKIPEILHFTPPTHPTGFYGDCKEGDMGSEWWNFDPFRGKITRATWKNLQNNMRDYKRAYFEVAQIKYPGREHPENWVHLESLKRAIAALLQ